MANTNENEIEIDPKVLDDETSDYETTGYQTDTTSLSSSVNDYVFENGRRYHSYFGTDKSLMPTDECEQDRLDIAHELGIVILNGRLHTAPDLESPHKILDVGTGTGIWAIDAAERYPSAEIIGIDLSPIQSPWVPPNVRFEVDDAELPWTFEDNTFDFIHFRNVSQGITKWDSVIADAYRCLKPGGTIELSETGVMFLSDDGSLKPGNGARHFSDLLTKAMFKIGRPAMEDISLLEERLKNGGFEGIESVVHKTPFGPWAKDKRLQKAGMFALLHAETGFHSYGLAALTRILGLDPDEADKVCTGGLAATKDKKNHMYTKWYFAYATKPE